jgi:hypothetical protein
MTSAPLHRAGVIAALALAIAAGVAKPALAQNDALLGVWNFIPERSTFTPGPGPYQSMTLNFSVTERGLQNNAKGVDADGDPIEATYMIVEDGKYYPVTGVARYNSSSYTRVSDRNTVYVRQKHGATVIVGSRVVSRDGKSLIFREKTVDDLGREKGRALLVFEKQGERAELDGPRSE